jgi:prophage DNA circulation protein
MAWRDQLRQGSYRNCPFFWQSLDADVGRRNVRHDYPLRDDAYFEDMGKCPREFTLEMYVIGPDYMAARDLLMAAFETAGPGILVHPTYGTLKVDVTAKVKVRETTAEGGMARFTASFALSGQNKQPSTALDTAGNVSDKADAATAASQASYVKTFTVAKNPAFVRASALSGLQQLTAKLKAIAQLIPTDLPASQFFSDLAGFETACSTLINTPSALANAIILRIYGAVALCTDPATAFGIWQGMFDFGSDWPAIAGTTPSRVQANANQAATIAIVRQAAVAGAAATSAEMTFASRQDAVAVRTAVTDQLDLQMESLTDITLYTAFADLRASVVTDIATRGANLALIVSYTPPQTVPALVLAYRLYGDATQAADIITRNKIRNPGFIPGGRPLEVLTNVNA